MAEIFEEYVANRERDGKLVESFRNNWKALKPHFGASLVSDLMNSRISEEACRNYTQHRINQGRSQGTVWTELTRLRSALNWAKKRKVIPDAPYIWIPTKPEPRDRVMTVDEVIRLIDASSSVPHLRLFVVLAITTSARTAAILELQWTRVDFDAGTINFREKQAANPLTKRVRKARALVPMTDEARAALSAARLVALTDNVIEWDGRHVLKIRKSFTAAVKRAGLGPDITPHVLRHTVLSWLDDEGIPMERISKLAGHRDLETTRKIYAKPSVNTLREAAEVIDIKLRKGVASGNSTR